MKTVGVSLMALSVCGASHVLGATAWAETARPPAAQDLSAAGAGSQSGEASAAGPLLFAQADLAGGANDPVPAGATTDAAGAQPVPAEVGGAATDTLFDAIASALSTNPTIRAEARARDIAGESLEQAQARRRPQISASTSAGFQRSGTNMGTNFVNPRNPGFYYRTEAPTATIGLEAVQPIYTGGALKAGVEQARAGVRAANSRFISARQGLILDVISAYLDVLTDEAELAIRLNNESVLTTQTRAARDRFDVGEVTRTDVAQAEARLSGAQAELAATRARLEYDRAVYAELVGRAPLQLQEAPPAPPLPATLEDAFARAVANNPLLLAARADSDGAEQAVRAAKAQTGPTVSIVGAAGKTQIYDEGTFKRDNAELTARLSVPLYQGGLLASQTRSSKLEAERARLRTRAFERSLTAEVARAWHNTIAAEEGIAASERQVDAAQIAFNGAEQELAVGLRTTLDVLDQEQELLRAKLGLVQARRASYLAKHQLLAAMGELTPETLGVNSPLSSDGEYAAE